MKEDYGTEKLMLTEKDRHIKEKPVTCNSLHDKYHIHWLGIEPWPLLSESDV